MTTYRLDVGEIITMQRGERLTLLTGALDPHVGPPAYHPQLLPIRALEPTVLTILSMSGHKNFEILTMEGLDVLIGGGPSAS